MGTSLKDREGRGGEEREGGERRTHQKGVPTKELAGDLREAEPKSAGVEREREREREER